uniref:RBR-type E3 ubiquitin transferase n=1 Tax=Biomphalaria glabrata TaxID=6526 RepID=A0A2C9JL94_BIOGL
MNINKLSYGNRSRNNGISTSHQMLNPDGLQDNDYYMNDHSDAKPGHPHQSFRGSFQPGTARGRGRGNSSMGRHGQRINALDMNGSRPDLMSIDTRSAQSPVSNTSHLVTSARQDTALCVTSSSRTYTSRSAASSHWSDPPSTHKSTKAAIQISHRFKDDDEVIATIKQHFANVGTLRLEEETIFRGGRTTRCTVVLTTEAHQPDKEILENMCKAMSGTLNKKVEFFIDTENSSRDRKSPDHVTHNNREEEIKENIEKILQQIETKTRSTIQKHEQKIEEQKKRYKELSAKTSEDNSAELMALKDKMEEQQKQLKMFLDWNSELNKKLHNLEPTKTSEVEVIALSRKVGIECQRLDNALPMYARRQDIIEKVTSNQVSVILGETGSGKSTQLVQYLYEAGLAKAGPIVCTQPRKVAAITLAERVAKEMVVNVGQLVGYKTGIKKMISKRGDTKIIFSTDHCLLNECLKDKHFSGYSCIIVDEAHERKLGKWINKLPFDPRQGFLIYHGFKRNLLYDSIVIASLLNNGSNMFYKGISETDQQKSSKTKLHYGSQDGDVFTWLEVYKDWTNVPKKSQSNWCKDKSINYKVVTYTKQSVDEMIQILKKEADIHVESSFGDIVSVTSFFQKLIFQAYMFSLSHYLGHFRAGYYALEVQKQVHFHPSSSLLSLNAKPEWIVYTEFMKTTKDFIKCISIVEEGWVQEALQEGRLSFDMEEVKKRKIEIVLREEIGLTMFRHLVGPKYLHLRELEEELSNSGMSTVVVEADREMGTIDIYSSSPMNSQVADNIKHCKQTILQTLVLEEDEIPLLKNTNGSDKTGFRVVLGQGAEVKSLFMPDESNKIIIRNSSFRTTEEEIRHKFSAFGEIVECIKFKSLNPWGFLRYKTKQEAKNAVELTKEDDNNVASLKTEFERTRAQSKFEAKVTWCRRPIKGNGTAFIKCSPIDQASLLGQYIVLTHGRCEIKLSREGQDLICFRTGKAHEREIENSILLLVGNDRRIARQLFVSVIRDKVETWNDEVKDMTALLTNELRRFCRDLQLPNNIFQINLLKPKHQTINYTGFIHFDKISEGEQLCQYMLNRLAIQGNQVEIYPSLKTTLHISESIMTSSQADFDEITEYLQSENQVEVKIRKLKLGDFAVDIRSKSATCLVQARDLFQKKLDGEIIDCSVSDLTRNILKHEGKKFLKTIEEEVGVLIVVDDRKQRIHLYGSSAKVTSCTIKINEFLDKLIKAKKSVLLLSGNEKPQGLMKEIMKRFGDLPNGIIEHFHLMDANIDFKQQKLSIFGSPEAVTQTENEIAAIEKDLALRARQLAEKWLPDCVVCMCPVESCTELYRLEGCGHSYCHTCLKAMVSVAVEDKQFPVDCVKENCSLALVWKDLRFCLKQNWISESKLAQRSLDSLVATNSRRYKYCKTANCPVVYEVTEDEQSHEFNCPACLISLCTSCHSNYHVGVSCKMFASQQEADLQFELWKKSDPKNRKLCPECRAPIEKTEGCNHMTCGACRAHFCWICLETFINDSDCYKHLRNIHGSIG